MKNLLEFEKAKRVGQPITMLTCYDYSFARLLNETDVDALLVGDSLAMTVLGHSSTLPVSSETMALFVGAVARGATKKFIVGDLPFLSYRKGLREAMTAVEVIMKAGAHAVKLEGLEGQSEIIRHIVTSGVPVMGHLGLTPQSVHQLGGYRVQGREEKAKQQILLEAEKLQELGCFSVVLECVPSELANEITKSLTIPTIGIGAGAGTDGQILVLQDFLGLNVDFKPKFVRTFSNQAAQTSEAISAYVAAVRERTFPSVDESFS